MFLPEVVKQTEVNDGEFFVSTIYVDEPGYSYYETIIFNDRNDALQEYRAQTREGALDNHGFALQWALDSSIET